MHIVEFAHLYSVRENVARNTEKKRLIILCVFTIYIYIYIYNCIYTY